MVAFIEFYLFDIVFLFCSCILALALCRFIFVYQMTLLSFIMFVYRVYLCFLYSYFVSKLFFSFILTFPIPVPQVRVEINLF